MTARVTGSHRAGCSVAHPAQAPAKRRDREAFFARVEEASAFDHLDDTAWAVAEVLDLPNRHVAEGEVDHVRHALPGDIRSL